MAIWRINNSTVLGNFVCAQWVPNTAYALGDRVVCRIAYGTQTARAYVYECTTAGTSHTTTEPVWPTSGTVADNDIVWTTRNPNDGAWDNASCILHYVLNHAAMAAGDFVYIHNAHNELSDINPYLIYGNGNENNPIKIICVNKADNSLSTGAIVGSSNATGNLHLLNYLYSYGVTYKCLGGHIILGYASNASVIIEGNNTVVIELEASGKYFSIVGGGRLERACIINGKIDFALANQYIYLGEGAGFNWKGGAVVAANGVTSLFKSLYNNHATIENVDLSGVGSGATATSLFLIPASTIFDLSFIRCKLPSDAGFTPTVGTFLQSMTGKVRFHHCSSANKTYDFLESCYEGTIEDEITIVRNGGASDGTTPQSWKMVSSANTVDNINPLISPPIPDWTESITQKTFTIECIVDSATNLQNDEVWMEFEYPVNNTDGLGGFARDKCAILGTPADKSTSVVTWNGTGGMANPNKFKCSVTVTPGKAGPITARICLAKPSCTIYVDPLITES